MANDYAYKGLTLDGRYSDDGEYFLVSFELNGVPIRFGNVYVGDQRESFQAAKEAASKQASGDTPPATSG
jgi:hypothetical protein